MNSVVVMTCGRTNAVGICLKCSREELSVCMDFTCDVIECTAC